MKKYLMMILAGTMAFLFTGCASLPTLSGLAADKPLAFNNVNDLESGKAYVWHDENVEDIMTDLSGANKQEVFFTCITGDINFAGDELATTYEYPRSIWVGEDMDENIPTLFHGDELIYISDTLVPDSFIFERFADYGYTIGISNMVADGGEHFYIPYAINDEDDYLHYIDMESDASELSEFTTITKLYLDRVDDTFVTNENVSDGGTVLNLERGKEYVCEFYTGTFYQDFLLTANIHSFGSFETFTSYDYRFLHSNCIAVKIPDYFVSGYYYINGLGLFRYVDTGDSFDENTNWNEPMIIYDELGMVVYDPSDEAYTDEVKDDGYGD